ncbi:hypothetical protein BASA83_000947 [Batrachochytrium salamandrivorans]|nr:hypothetical protein BASA83_000947 [Batrachochytrium salamandrivorans]
MLQNLQLHQRVFLGDLCVEEWHFEFGFVIPGSTNTWNMVTEAASPEDMLPIELISGSLITDTQLMDGDKVLHHSKLRLFYV